MRTRTSLRHVDHHGNAATRRSQRPPRRDGRAERTADRRTSPRSRATSSSTRAPQGLHARASARSRTATTRLAKANDFDYADALGVASTSPSPRISSGRKALWVQGNPYYERVEGIVAGTPSLAVYDVILDAGSSAAEDPESAVPFDLRLPNGKVLQKPGNLYNLTEGMLWGTASRAGREEGRSRRRRSARVRRGAAGRERPQGGCRCLRPLRRQARRRGSCLEADHVRRLHRGRRDGADDERVLRAVEGLALRARRQGQG